LSNNNYNQLILRALHLTSDIYICLSQIEFNGTLYKIGYFLTNYNDEICVNEILEIIFINENSRLKFIVQQIEINFYNCHLRAYQINKTKKIILKTILSPEDCSGPPININELFNGNLMLRLKEYFSD